VPAVVSANPGAGDVKIVVQNQAGTPIAGAQARIFWAGLWDWMDGAYGKAVNPIPIKLTDANGTATYTAADISAFRANNPTATLVFQVGASDTNGNYGNVYTWAVANEDPCITYNASTEYTFTYNLIMFQKAAPTVTWGTGTVTVTYTLGETLTATLTPKMGFFHGPLASHTTSIFQCYPKAGGGYAFYDMIDTNEDGTITVADYVAATVSGTSLSASLPLKFLAGINDDIITVPFLVKTPVTHTGLSSGEQSAAEDMYGVGSSLTVGIMTLSSEAVGMTANVPAPILSISVSPLFINFGTLYAGGPSSAAQTITVTNTAPVLKEAITATVINESRAGFYAANLTLDTVSVAAWEITGLDASLSQPVSAVLTVPVGTEVGTLTATLVFWAEEATP